MKSKTSAKLSPSESALRKFALDLPGATEEFPWGSRAFKAGGKAFVFLSNLDGVLSIGTKLPVSNRAALKQSFASPTHYGLGKHGWVTCEFQPADEVPMDLLFGYIRESYQAVAPKKLTKPKKSAAKK